MRYSFVYVSTLAGLSSAAPAPQFGLPFSIPSGLTLPTGLTLPSGLSLPTGLSIPGFGNAVSGAAGSKTSAAAAQPTSTGSSTPTNNAACTAQGSSGGGTENGVVDNNCCAELTVIFARGTSETGNVGTIAGPPMFKSLRSKLGADKVLVQGVDYPASAAGNANLGADGGPKMAELVKTALSQCPDTKVIVSGYSQGAMVVHNAFSAQGLKAAQVKGAVLFGDPLKSQSVGDLPSSSVKEFCASGDLVCEGGTGVITAAHLTYGNNADEAAAFAIQAAGV